MNKTLKIGIISASALGLVVATLIVGTGQPTGMTTDQRQTKSLSNAAFPSDSPVTDLIARQEVSSPVEAKSLLGYDVKAPSDLPSGYKTQITTVQPEIGIATILVSPEPVEKGVTTRQEFLYEHKGIVVFMEMHDPTFDKQAFLQAWASERNATSVRIGDNDGFIHEVLTHTRFDQFVQEPAELVFFDGDLLVELRGMVPATDLVKAAESMK